MFKITIVVGKNHPVLLEAYTDGITIGSVRQELDSTLIIEDSKWVTLGSAVLIRDSVVGFSVTKVEKY